MGTGGVEFGIYVPQVALSYDEVLARALLVESLGFSSLWLFDHLYTPDLPAQPAFEGWTLATALLAQTTRLRVGHLVLCNTFRHPALLGRMATTLDVVSGGRLDLGLGSGSYEPEHRRSGISWGTLRERSEQLGESLEVLQSMFRNTTTSFSGQYFRLEDLPNLPPPVQPGGPPIHVGGAGERFTLPLVARYADVWNVPTYALGDWRRRLDVVHAECDRIGRDPATLRLSQEVVLVLAEDDRRLAKARAIAERRFGAPGFGLAKGGLIGTPEMVIEAIARRVADGVTMFVLFTHDRAGEATLRLLAESVMSHFA